MAKPSYLSPFEAPKPAEIDSLPADGELLFLDIHSINALRSVQHSIHAEAIDHIRSSHGGLLSYTEIDAEASSDCDEAYMEVTADFLKQFITEDAPNYDEYLSIVRSFSIDKISEEEMALGKVDDTTGERDEETAGYKLLESIRLDKISELTPTDTAAELKAEQVADAATKKAEHDIAVGNLNGAREALARAEVEYRTKSMFGRKKHKRAELEALQEAYRLASKAEAVAGFESIKANHIAEDKDEPTAKELNIIAQMAFAEEFKKFANEQNNEAYLTEYGKKARKFGEVSLGKRLKRTALILGLGAVGMATGGVFAAGLFGTATALRIWQTKSAGTVGHSTKKGTERITNKINKKIVRDTKAGLSINETGNTNDLADMISTGHKNVSERTRRSNSIRRKLVPVLMASAAAGGVVKSIAEWNEKKDLVGNVRENLTDFDWRHPLHEWNPFNHNEGPSGSGSVRDTADNLVPGSGGTSEGATGGDFGQTGAPGAAQEAAAARAAAREAADIAAQQAADLANLDRLVNAQGNYPWGRAMDFFNGDSQAANTWLQTAVSKTPGAQWHNVGDGISTNDWISINGVSDTDAVWKELTKNMV